MLFGMFIVVYLFLGGCTAGLLLVTALRSLMFSSRRRIGIHDEAMREAFGRFTDQCYIVILIMALASSACLLCDLGSPEKSYILFIHPALTPITVGGFALAANIVIAAMLVATGSIARLGCFDGNAEKLAIVRKGLEIAALPASILLMGYTGLFLALIKQVPLWNTPLTVVLFVLSALSAGCALSQLIHGCTEARSYMTGADAALHPMHWALLVAEIAVIALFLIVTASRPEVAVARSLELLTNPPLLWWVIGGLVALGLGFPLVAETAMSWLTVRRMRDGVRWYGLMDPLFCFPADVACLIGCFLLRYCLVAAGLH